MANPINWRPSDRTRKMLTELLDHYNIDTPGALGMAVASLYRTMQQEKEETAATKQVYIVNNLERGLWIDTGNGRIAAAHSNEDGSYSIGHGPEMMPADSSHDYETLEQLISAMRAIQPDLRKWRLVEA